MAEVLDWSDPSKLMRRDGGEVLACGKSYVESIDGSESYWATSRPSTGAREETNWYYPSGLWVQVKRSRCDIIPRPREPRSFYAWVRPEALGHVDTYNSWSFLLRKPKDDTIGYVRVKVTEVLSDE